MNEIVYHHLHNGVEIWLVRLSGDLPNRTQRGMRPLYYKAIHDILTNAGLNPQIGKKDTGQPYLVNHQSLHISLSHRNEYVAVALSEQEVGIDVESFNPNLERAKEYYLNRQERALNLDQEDLLLIWCAKEALYKKLGGLDVRPEVEFTFEKRDQDLLLKYREMDYYIHWLDFGEMKIVWI